MEETLRQKVEALLGDYKLRKESLEVNIRNHVICENYNKASISKDRLGYIDNFIKQLEDILK